MTAPGTCFQCDEHVGEESFCYGCNVHVCSTCAVGNPMGPHDADDHLTDPDLNEEDYDDEL